MARYLLTNIPPRTELIPAQDNAECTALVVLLDENERLRLKSYRPPTGVDVCAERTSEELLGIAPSGPDRKVTGRWTAEERDALLALARATIDASEDRPPARDHTVPPPHQTRRVTIRRAPGEVVMTDVRRRLRGSG